MKKFHTLPGVIPRVGVAEGQGAFERWSFTASAALLLLLSTEGARGNAVVSMQMQTPASIKCRHLLDAEIQKALGRVTLQPGQTRQSIGGESFRCCGPNAQAPVGFRSVGSGCTATGLPGKDPNFAGNQIFYKEPAANNAASTTPTQPTTVGGASAGGATTTGATTDSGSGTTTDPGTTTGTETEGTASAPVTGGGTFSNLSGTFPRGNSPSPKPSSAFPVGSPSSAPSPTTTPGSTAGGNSTKAYTSKIRDWDSKFDQDRKNKKEAPNADPCVISSELGEGQGGIYKCAGTRRALDNSQQITAGAVVAGTVGMAMKNQNAVNEALQSGSQSGNLDAQASIQSGQEEISKTIGAIQMTQALILKSKADSHGKNIRQLEGNLLKKDVTAYQESIQVDPNKDATAALEKFISKDVNNNNVGVMSDIGVGEIQTNKFGTNTVGIDAIKAETAKAAAADLNTAMKKIGNAAVVEQKEIQSKASEESMKLFQQAAIAFTVAEQARKNKEILRQTAQSVKQVEKSTKDLAFQFAPNDRSANQLAAPNQSLSLSSAQDASQSKTDGLGQNGTDEPGESPNFDLPYGAPTDPIPQASPQPVGDFQRNPSGGGGGGGGGGAGGGTSTQPSGNDDDHGGGGGSTYAKLPTTSDRYTAGGGGVGGSGGGGGNAGMDFTGMLSQFLPKPEDQGPKNGILDFGARAPAQTTLPSSLLDASANLFERVHEAYQSKNRKGQVGQALSGGKNP